MSLSVSTPSPPPAVGGSPRDRILDEAAALFLRHGYAGTSLRQVADVVGMKAASLYHHFPSKDVLLTEVLARGIEVMHRAFDEAATSAAGQEPEGRLAAHVRAHLAALFENGPYTAAHVTTFRTAPPEVVTAVVPLRDRYEARWSELLRSLRGDGALAEDLDLDVTRLVLLGAMNSSIEWFDPRRGNLDLFAEAVTRHAWRGVAA